MMVAFVGLLLLFNEKVEAKEVVGSASSENIFGDLLGTIQIYDDGEIKFQYKYGLKRADLYYCKKGEMCDNDNYSWVKILEASEETPYKNNGAELAKYSYEVELEENSEYRFVVEAYFALSSSYKGNENIEGSFMISDKQIADTKDQYIKIDSGYDDSRIGEWLDDMKLIVNTIVLPVLYVLISMLLVIKGAILGFQIVKNADKPDIRREKIGALTWLVIGVVVAYAASTVVGVLTGFFEDMF